MKSRLIIIVWLSIMTLSAGCMKDEPLQIPIETIVPVPMEDGWITSDPFSEGFDADMLEQVYADLSDEDLYPNFRSLLVFRNGKLVSEAYFKSREDIGRIHDIMSVTKSITSILAGIALDKGLIGSLDDPIYKYLPDYFDNDPVKKSITVRQALTMETGLDFNNDIHTGQMFYSGGSSLRFILAQPVVYDPGTEWYYGDGNPQLISGIIQHVTGKNMEDFAIENLFEPLGISDYYWEKHSDGITFGAFGLWLVPRDMAKFGQLMMNGGSWNNQQIVSEAWVSESTKVQSVSSDYGYYWFPENDGHTFKASGQGGQIIWVWPEKQLMVVVTNDSFSKSWELTKGSWNLPFTSVVNAMIR